MKGSPALQFCLSQCKPGSKLCRDVCLPLGGSLSYDPSISLLALPRLVPDPSQDASFNPMSWQQPSGQKPLPRLPRSSPQRVGQGERKGQLTHPEHLLCVGLALASLYMLSHFFLKMAASQDNFYIFTSQRRKLKLSWAV